MYYWMCNFKSRTIICCAPGLLVPLWFFFNLPTYAMITSGFYFIILRQALIWIITVIYISFFYFFLTTQKFRIHSQSVKMSLTKNLNRKTDFYCLSIVRYFWISSFQLIPPASWWSKDITTGSDRWNWYRWFQSRVSTINEGGNLADECATKTVSMHWCNGALRGVLQTFVQLVTTYIHTYVP